MFASPSPPTTCALICNTAYFICLMPNSQIIGKGEHSNIRIFVNILKCSASMAGQRHDVRARINISSNQKSHQLSPHSKSNHIY